MPHTRNKSPKNEESPKKINASVMQLCHLLGLSCARYRKFKRLEAPELILKVEAMLMQKYMSHLVQAESRCVN